MKFGDLKEKRSELLKILGFDVVDVLGIAAISSYLTLTVASSKSKGRSTPGILLSIASGIVKSGLTKVDESIHNYVEEKDEEMLEKVKAVKRTGVRTTEKTYKDESKFEIFM